MLRSARFHRHASRLALAAILLLALVPTLGRLAQAREAAAHATPWWAAMCTARGLQPVLLAPGVREAGAIAVTTPAPPPPSPHDAGSDCDYCPLLATALPVALPPPSVPPAALPPALCTPVAQVAHAQPHPCGLGSRGPPPSS